MQQTTKTHFIIAIKTIANQLEGESIKNLLFNKGAERNRRKTQLAQQHNKLIRMVEIYELKETYEMLIEKETFEKNSPLEYFELIAQKQEQFDEALFHFLVDKIKHAIQNENSNFIK